MEWVLGLWPNLRNCRIEQRGRGICERGLTFTGEALSNSGAESREEVLLGSFLNGSKSLGKNVGKGRRINVVMAR